LAVIAVLLYIGQIIEYLYSQTFRLLWNTNKVEDFAKFKQWFVDIKKCRPEISLVYRRNRKIYDLDKIVPEEL